MRFKWLLLLPAALLIVQGCATVGDTTSDPRKAVLNMIKAMEESDREALVHYLDFRSLMTPGKTDYALQMDSVRVFMDIEAVLDDLTEGGLTNDRWMSMQRVVGSAERTGDTAYVEVSFISQETGKQYYNKWGLSRINERWKIFNFHCMQEKE
ncbi:MAG: hypothetical protein GY841_08505 [FCB group bacterium]|nr:hypothetical protein [FCB group bacterium]